MPATIYRLVNDEGQTFYIGSTTRDPYERYPGSMSGKFEELLVVPIHLRFKYEYEAIRTAFEDGELLWNKRPKKTRVSSAESRRRIDQALTAQGK
jgi:hypothetical protein